MAVILLTNVIANQASYNTIGSFLGADTTQFNYIRS